MTHESFQNLPGAELVIPGLADLADGRRTEAALLVASGSSSLRELGIEIRGIIPDQPEHALYNLLAQTHGNEAHGRYNALIRRLVSFRRALEGRQRSAIEAS